MLLSNSSQVPIRQSVQSMKMHLIRHLTLAFLSFHLCIWQYLGIFLWCISYHHCISGGCVHSTPCDSILLRHLFCAHSIYIPFQKTVFDEAFVSKFAGLLFMLILYIFCYHCTPWYNISIRHFWSTICSPLCLVFVHISIIIAFHEAVFPWCFLLTNYISFQELVVHILLML